MTDAYLLSGECKTLNMDPTDVHVSTISLTCFIYKTFHFTNNKTGLQPVAKPVEHEVGFFKER